MSEPVGTPPTERASATIFAWEMWEPNSQAWNIIGIQMPGGALPMITSRFDLAWEAFDVAQAHANRYDTKCRLASYAFETALAIVVPEPPEGGDDER